MVFSAKVVYDKGIWKNDPRQPHLNFRPFNIETITLKILIIIKIMVNLKLSSILTEFNKHIPNIISIKGYKYPYKLIFFDIKSYLENIVTNLSKLYSFNNPKINKVNPM